VLQVNVDDVWSWIPDPAVGYTVKGAYRTLTSGMASVSTTPVVSVALIWRKNVPLKVSIFGWRLFGNKLLTKANLFRRGIIQHDAQLCVTGCGDYQLLENIKLLSFWWYKTQFVVYHIKFHD